MDPTVNVNGLSLVHRKSGGVSDATLPDVCLTPPSGAPVPYTNTAFSKDLARGTRSIAVDGGNPAATSLSAFAKSSGDEPGSRGGVASGTVGDEATFLSYSFDVKLEGRGAARLTDKMLHNAGNTVDCGGVRQNKKPVPGKDSARKERERRKLAAASAKRRRKEGKLEIAVQDVPHFEGSDPNNPDVVARRDAVLKLAWDMGARFIRVNVYWGKPDTWWKIDAFVDAAQAKGFKVQVTVTGGAANWTGKKGFNVVPAEFAAFAKDRVAHYYAKGVRRFCLWNEPNHPMFLAAGKKGTKFASLRNSSEVKQQIADAIRGVKGLAVGDQKRADELAKAKLPPDADAATIDKRADELVAQSKSEAKRSKQISSKYKSTIFEACAKSYVRIYQAGYKATRPVAKDAQILMGELSSADALEFIRLMAKHAKGTVIADGLALHPYQYKVDPRKPDPTRPDAGGMGRLWEMNLLLDELKRKKKMRTPKKKALPIFLTEFGYHKKEGRPPVGTKLTKRKRGNRVVKQWVSDRQLSESTRALHWKRALEVSWKEGTRQMLIYQLIRGGDYYNEAGKQAELDGIRAKITAAKSAPANTKAEKKAKAKKVAKLEEKLHLAMKNGAIQWDTSVIDSNLAPDKSYFKIKSWADSHKSRLALEPPDLEKALKP